MNIYQQFTHIKHKPLHSTHPLTGSFPDETLQEESTKKTTQQSENTRCKKDCRGYVDINCA